MPRQTVSAFVVCKNEESQIRRCLESIKWCDEIVAIDSGSTDRTVDICREFTDKVFFREWTGYVDQKRFGLEKCSSEWVLNIDADEEVSPELRNQIQQILSSGNSRYNGYNILRVVHYLGRWWRRGGWYPEYRLRLCRKSDTTWGGDDPHEKAIVKGETTRLSGELYHYTYSSITDQINRLNSFSTSAAKSMFEKGEQATIMDMILRPLVRFLKFFILKRGFLDGLPAFIVAILESYYVFLKYAKLWEMQRRP